MHMKVNATDCAVRTLGH